VNRRILGLAVLGLALGSSVALARNFHCAGGIQYVIQGTKEKDKGNLDDAHRIFGKAVAQLTECVKEDPNDSESWSYLGWAYCEVDSPALAHDAFTEGRKRLAAEPKKIDLLNNNWKAYWVGYYNQGLAHYNEAKVFVPDWEDVPAEVVRRSRPGDVVVTMGAPPISLMGDELLVALLEADADLGQGGADQGGADQGGADQGGADQGGGE